MSTIGLIWRTVRHLQPKQVVYQVINRLRGRSKLHLPKRTPTAHFLTVSAADKPVSYINRTFTFLNQPVSFPDAIDWNYAQNGKLWTYNLTYFDYLNQAGSSLTQEEGHRLILDFIAQTSVLQAGLEPYPTSLRIVNWVHFLSRNSLHTDRINTHLFAQITLLNNRLEYHLAGNHLLENGFALLTGALYFQQRKWFNKAARLIRKELARQILADGAHDERSPMYHQILLDRLLDVLIALQADSWHNDSELCQFLSEKASLMLRWLDAVTFQNGDVPMVNDAASGIAPCTMQIRAKAMVLPSPPAPRPTWARGVENSESAPLSQVGRGVRGSGYRLVRQPRYELFADVGAVGPDHQPGHAHADTFSFILHVDGKPVIVDSGTSTYQIGARRTWERSTAAHNTVAINGLNSSEVWDGFRVGRRASVTILSETETSLSASHDGYSCLSITHVRTWCVKLSKISILDRVLGDIANGDVRQPFVARLHFHPDIAVILNTDCVTAGPIDLTFLSDALLTLALKPYDMADGFNRLRPGQCLEITGSNFLNTIITVSG